MRHLLGLMTVLLLPTASFAGPADKEDIAKDLRKAPTPQLAAMLCSADRSHKDLLDRKADLDRAKSQVGMPAVDVARIEKEYRDAIAKVEHFRKEVGAQYRRKAGRAFDEKECASLDDSEPTIYGGNGVADLRAEACQLKTQINVTRQIARQVASGMDGLPPEIRADFLKQQKTQAAEIAELERKLAAATQRYRKATGKAPDLSECEGPSLR